MQLLPFLLVAGAIVVAPGVDMALVTRNVLLHGRRAGVVTAVGVNTGVLLWSLAASFGLAALLVASATTYRLVEIGGAAYLVFVGIRALWASFHRAHEATKSGVGRSLPSRVAFRQGMLCNIFNPKVGVLFTSLLPQFAGDRATTADFLLMGGIFNAMGLAWLISYTLIVARSRDVFLRPRIRRALDRFSGIILVGLGIRLALERRS